MQRAAEAASQGAASQALASGTRAQRQLQDMREQLRKENSSQFSEDMRQMRAEARDLARQQGDIVQKMQDENRAAHKALSDSGDRKDLVDRLARQQQRLTNLVDRATQISQEAETAEPVLSRQLYDTMRKFSQDTGQGVQDVQDELLKQGLASRSLLERLGDKSEQDGAKLLETTAELVRQDFLPQASATGQRVRGNLDNLKRGVERAAESVLGDDTEALRLAKQELDQLMDQLQREGAQASGNGRTNQAAQLAAADGQRQQNERNGGDRQRQNPSERANQSGQARQEASGQRSQSQAGGERAGETAQAQDGQPGQENPSEQTGNRSGRSANNQTASKNGGQQGNDGAPQDGEPQPGDRGEQADRAGQQNQPQIAQGNRGNRGARDSAQRGGARNLTGDNYGGGYTGGPLDLDRILNPDDRYLGGPLTGDNFVPWSDRLREVEEMIDTPELRNSVAAARERARVMRQEFKKDLKKPDWAVVRLQVISPLVEVRDRIAEELARRESTASLVPIDRDPVPNRYSDLVRKYYEELGKDNETVNPLNGLDR
jgi:archaellum component FlaC